MSRTQSKWMAFAASIRLPNLPSVLCNTATAVLLVGPDHFSQTQLAWILVSAACLYLSGNLFNDLADRNWDAEHRPERAIPMGYFSPSSYRISGVLLMLTAWVCAGLTTPAAFTSCVVISLAILSYTWLHKRSAWSVVPMALCRALLPVMGWFACAAEPQGFTWAAAAATLFSYMVVLSLSARNESKPSAGQPQTPFALWFLIPAILAATANRLLESAGLAAIAIGAIPYFLWMLMTWTRFRKPVPRMVSALLAGIPLVDAMLLIPLALRNTEFTPTLWIWLPAFALGRILQRAVPAT